MEAYQWLPITRILNNNNKGDGEYGGKSRNRLPGVARDSGKPRFYCDLGCKTWWR